MMDAGILANAVDFILFINLKVEILNKDTIIDTVILANKVDFLLFINLKVEILNKDTVVSITDLLFILSAVGSSNNKNQVIEPEFLFILVIFSFL